MTSPIHLAELLQEEMAERGWSMNDLVMNMGPHFSKHDWAVCQLSWEMFFAVREPSVILGDTMAHQLGEAFDIDPRFFTNFHESWRKSAMAEHEQDYRRQQ